MLWRQLRRANQLLRHSTTLNRHPPTMPLPVYVFADKDSPALNFLPKSLDVAYNLICSAKDLASLDASTCLALVYVPPHDPASLMKVLETSGTSKRWLHSFSAGVDGLIPGLNGIGLTNDDLLFSNGRGAFSDSLAEYAMAAILHFNKQVPRIQANRKARLWDRFEMDVVAGKTLGIVGYGHIGQMCAKYAKGMGMRVVGLRRDPTKADPLGLADKQYGFDDRDQLYAESDYVLCALPGTQDTTDFFSTAAFDAMKNDAVFISLGRGVCVDETALVEALRNEKIKGAALDVFKQEPLSTESELWDCENLLITAHNADLTSDYLELGWQKWQENLDSFLKDGTVVTPVDIKSGY